jgi:hypothetical protein
MLNFEGIGVKNASSLGNPLRFAKANVASKMSQVKVIFKGLSMRMQQVNIFSLRFFH